MKIRAFSEADWPAVQVIYLQGIGTKNATFQTKAKTWEEWNLTTHRQCRLVAVEGENVAGWGALSPVSDRWVYRGVAEVSVYVGTGWQGRGVGKLLLSALVAESEQAGFWTLQAGIFPENVASVRLHEKCGFRLVGVRERLGQLEDRWRDVLLMERRSPVVGG
jgi:L-amino acid N-acyltransferase YncA